MRAPLVALLTSLALVAGGCGGDSPSVEEWAESFCVATNEWDEDIDAILDDVDDAAGLSTQVVQEAVADTREATTAYVDEVRGLGRPDLEAGDAVEAALDELADEVDSELAEIEDALDEASGLNAPVGVAREITSSVASMYAAFERAFEAIAEADSDREIRAAFASVEACANLGR